MLSDAYTSLMREERQALLHDGSTVGGGGGGATMSAFVEIEFDNSDGRFPTSMYPFLLLSATRIRGILTWSNDQINLPSC